MAAPFFSRRQRLWETELRCVALRRIIVTSGSKPRYMIPRLPPLVQTYFSLVTRSYVLRTRPLVRAGTYCLIKIVDRRETLSNYGIRGICTEQSLRAYVYSYWRTREIVLFLRRRSTFKVKLLYRSVNHTARYSICEGCICGCVRVLCGSFAIIYSEWIVRP